MIISIWDARKKTIHRPMISGASQARGPYIYGQCCFHFPLQFDGVARAAEFRLFNIEVKVLVFSSWGCGQAIPLWPWGTHLPKLTKTGPNPPTHSLTPPPRGGGGVPHQAIAWLRYMRCGLCEEHEHSCFCSSFIMCTAQEAFDSVLSITLWVILLRWW